ncbi:hypothetical protein [cf. Phormidesmis sp. LEGE 11477]|uniref:hypothetical protein n=1 Tax=cf. Phormidesmis sp. LEGE 11477 TaxID=1828680 RepID=UPI00187E8B3D|nr:hypothetical protein [cf. Phormidesmis sp. LEGE 11477]MBE9064690.1 hypothetical protein [cf. Phormidesmis sp. LEGE 11477]
MTILRDYQNRPIRLTDERLAHILLHPEMVGMEPAIIETIKHPNLVRKSKSDDAINLLYRFYNQTTVGDKWLCVVVKYLPTDAFIITAYFTDKPKKGVDVWPSR